MTPARDLLQVVLSLGAGGTERLVVDMCLRLRDTARIKVVCLDEPGEWARHLQAVGIDVAALHRPPGFRLGIAAGVRRAAAGLHRPAIHCHHYTPFVYGAVASMVMPGTRLVYTEHGRYGDGPPSAKRRLANQIFGRLPGHFFAVSHDLRAHLIAEGVPASRLQVNHNGIEPGAPPSAEARAGARAALGVADGDWVLGTVARLDPVKDLTTLVEAAALLVPAMPALRVAVVGDGPERRRLESLARERGIEQRFVFTGHRDDARALMAGFDVYVNCSVIEGISVTILEALAAGLPVAASRVGGTPEVLGDDEFGVMFPSRSPPALAEALRALTPGTARAGALAAVARRRVEDAFSVTSMLARYTDAYGW